MHHATCRYVTMRTMMFSTQTLNPAASASARPRPRCRCPCCSARSCCPPAAAAAKSRGRGASPSPARACGWPPPPPALQLPAARHRQPRVIHLAHCHLHGLKAGLLLHLLELWTIYRKNVNIGSFWWWFFRSLGQSHTFLFFSCETLSPNPKLAQVLDFFLLEQRIVSTGEKFYSKYLFESQIMIYIT